MSRRQPERLEDIVVAIEEIRAHLARGSLDDGLVYDAVRMRLLEIGEAAKALDANLLAHAPEVPWVDIAGMRDRLAHRYFDTDHAIVVATVRHSPPQPRAPRPRCPSAPRPPRGSG